MQKTLTEIFSALLRLLTGPDYELRRRSLISISKLRGDMAADLIFERYQSDNLEDYLVLAVSRMDPKKSAPILISALSDMHLEARLTAAETLIKQRSEESVSALIATVEAYLKEEVAGKKENLLAEEALQGIVRVLGGIATPMCLALLRKLILQEKNERVRATVVGVLGQHINDSMIPMFQGLLSDKDPRVQANAIEALGNLNKNTTVGILQPYLYDSNPRVKANAVKAIFRFGDFDVSSTLKEMLASHEKNLRVSAIYAIGEIKLEPYFKNLLGYMKDGDPDVRRNAVVALRKFQKKDFAIQLIPMLDDPAPEVRLQAAIGVGELYQEQGVQPLLKRLEKEPAPHIRSNLATIIGKYGKEEHFPLLLPFLNDEDDRVIGNVIEALQKLKPKQPHSGAVTSLRRFLDSSNNRIRANAIRVLWEWGFTDVLDALLKLISGDSPETIMSGMYCIGEVFSLVSHENGNMLKTFDGILKTAVEEHRKKFIAKGGAIGDSKVRGLWESSQSAIKAGKLKDARKLLEQILKVSPNLHQVFVALGELSLREGALDEAETNFLRALSISPNILKAHYALGQIYHRKREWLKAINSLQVSIRLYPKLPQAYLILAEAFEMENRWQESAETLKRLSSLVPKNLQVLQRLTRSISLAGAVGDAIPVARAAAAIGPVDAFTMLIMAVGEHFSGASDKGFVNLMGVLGMLAEKPDGRSLADTNRLSKIFQGLISRKGKAPVPG